MQVVCLLEMFKEGGIGTMIGVSFGPLPASVRMPTRKPVSAVQLGMIAAPSNLNSPSCSFQ